MHWIGFLFRAATHAIPTNNKRKILKTKSSMNIRHEASVLHNIIIYRISVLSGVAREEVYHHGFVGFRHNTHTLNTWVAVLWQAAIASEREEKVYAFSPFSVFEKQIFECLLMITLHMLKMSQPTNRQSCCCSPQPKRWIFTTEEMLSSDEPNTNTHILRVCTERRQQPQ